KNHLKQDIAQVFQITKSMKKLFAGKEVMIHNIYISGYEPVDDWEQLKKPLQLDEKNSPLKMHVYYFTGKSIDNELTRLEETLSLTPFSNYGISSEHEANKALALYKRSFGRLKQ